MTKFITLAFLTVLFTAANGVTMSPHRPDLMIFVSPDKQRELHSPIHEKSVLVIKKFLANNKITWPNKMDVSFVFSDPTSDRIITVGGLGDSGSSLGEVEFYTFEGAKTTIQVKDLISNLEELSRKYSDFSNFTWITAIDITAEELLIWVCDKILVRISFQDLKGEVVSLKAEPSWVSESKNQVVSARAQKLQWQLKK